MKHRIAGWLAILVAAFMSLTVSACSDLGPGATTFTLGVDRDPQTVYNALSNVRSFGSTLADADLDGVEYGVEFERDPGKAVTLKVATSSEERFSTLRFEVVPGAEPGKAAIKASIDVPIVVNPDNPNQVISESKVATLFKSALGDMVKALDAHKPVGSASRRFNAALDILGVATNPQLAGDIQKSLLAAFAEAGTHGGDDYGHQRAYGEPDDYGEPMVDPDADARGYGE